ncbi:hypothetical protein B0T14DRAFT_5968 [Immersiella caudata]|uniref:Uncharacterized protein n=1 Tax=Immersiella caudata TaxID=314043 RepID=A0AA39XDX6_9PEZI|nr:hypothetical protein B0T14DRAFT_5968 [Immersiella caudata]
MSVRPSSPTPCSSLFLSQVPPNPPAKWMSLTRLVSPQRSVWALSMRSINRTPKMFDYLAWCHVLFQTACASHLFAEGAIEAIAKVTTRYSESVKDSGFKELYYEPDSSKNFLENLCLSAMSASSLATTGFMIFKDNIFSANSTVAAGWWTGVILGSTYLSWKKSIRKDKARKKLSELAA